MFRKFDDFINSIQAYYIFLRTEPLAINYVEREQRGEWQCALEQHLCNDSDCRAGLVGASLRVRSYRI